MTNREIFNLTEQYIAPFSVMLAVTGKRNPSASDIITNGTGALVATGRDELLVTNFHVYDSFVRARVENPDAAFIMSGAHGTRFLDISSAEVKGLNCDVDLAVLRMPAKIAFSQGKMMMPHIPWPPRRPEKGMMAIVYGYPGQGRQSTDSVNLGVSALSLLLPIVSVSSRHFVLVDERGDSEVFVPEGQQPLTSFGGVSGSPVFVLAGPTEVSEGALYLGGFIYEALDSGVFLVSHADHINADGSIR